MFCQNLFSNTKSTSWHEIQAEKFAILHPIDKFKFFIISIDISSRDFINRGYAVSIEGKSYFFVVIFCIFNNFLYFKCTFCWPSKKAFITIIWFVVFLYKASNACFITPVGSFKTIPSLFKDIFRNFGFHFEISFVLSVSNYNFIISYSLRIANRIQEKLQILY